MKKFFKVVIWLYVFLSLTYIIFRIADMTLLFFPVCFAIMIVFIYFCKIYFSTELSKSTKVANNNRKYYEEQKTKEQKSNFMKHYDTVVKPMYHEGQRKFNILMKEGKLRNYDILELKHLINRCLGKHLDYYHNYRFDTDAKEIYVKMKNFNLNEYDWEMIIEFLDSRLQNSKLSKPNNTLKKKAEVN